MLSFLTFLIICVIVIGLAVRFKAVRWLLVFAGFCIFALIVYVLAYSNAQREKYEASKHVFGPGDIQFEEMALTPQYAGYRLTGRVRNSSERYDLVGGELKFTMQDCVAQACDTIGESTVSLYTTVPKGQVRAIDHGIYFSGMPRARGWLTWSYHVDYLRGTP